MRIFDGFLDVEGADRLSPFKSETPKSRENSRFWAGSDYTRHPKLTAVEPISLKSAICSTFDDFTPRNTIVLLRRRNPQIHHKSEF